MQDLEIINLWKSYDNALNKTLSLNKQNAEEITKLKTQSLLSTMKPIKIFAICIGILWILFIDGLIYNLWGKANWFFIISALLQSILTKIAIGVYLYQLVVMETVDISEPIISTQKKIVDLKNSTLWIARCLFLQLPLWTTFYWNESMLENGNIILWSIQAIVTLAFLILGVWLFFNIKFENRNKAWFKFLFEGKEWTPLMRSMDLLEEIDAFKEE